MDEAALQSLAKLVRTCRIAALGSISDSGPFVSMIPVVPSSDWREFYFIASGLAKHTRNILADSRIGMLLTETDTGEGDPARLARVSVQGTVEPVQTSEKDFKDLQNLYLDRFPGSEMLFGLGDFLLYRIKPVKARFVAGFGNIYNLVPSDFSKAAGMT